jgi:hypothetical protein
VSAAIAIFNAASTTLGLKLEAISKIPVVIKGRASAHFSKKKKSKNPQNSSLFLWFFDSFIFKICTKFAALLTKGAFEMASRKPLNKSEYVQK